jgi:hypothetical protein
MNTYLFNWIVLHQTFISIQTFAPFYHLKKKEHTSGTLFVNFYVEQYVHMFVKSHTDCMRLTYFRKIPLIFNFLFWSSIDFVKSQYLDFKNLTALSDMYACPWFNKNKNQGSLLLTDNSENLFKKIIWLVFHL